VKIVPNKYTRYSQILLPVHSFISIQPQRPGW